MHRARTEFRDSPPSGRDQTETLHLVDSDPHTSGRAKTVAELLGLSFEEHTSGDAFLRVFRADRPGCVVLNTKVSDGSGLGIYKSLKRQPIVPQVIFLGEDVPVSLVVQLLRSGALHFLETPCHEGDLFEAVQEAVGRDRQQRSARRRQAEIYRRIALLTDLEKELLQRILAGISNQAISEEYSVTSRTVETWRARLIKKLGIRRPIDLLKMAYCVARSRLPDGCAGCLLCQEPLTGPDRQ